MAANCSKNIGLKLFSVSFVTVLYIFVMEQSSLDSPSLFFKDGSSKIGLTSRNFYTKGGKKIDQRFY